ncbi:hypothetical protein QTH97_34580 [Variovorax sp. J22R24]|uniref:hypothetical protein n=1 Tax=Variovorax gracilis TaxID=3053502 RepID=UPI0025789BF0|nr:hypothetical protein [Variovorax sp. J22R24]MDM0110072.1 hypothetical protein [Variovorax sp. J22R24]
MNDMAELVAVADSAQAREVQIAPCKRRKSQQLPDPAALFAGWAFRIEQHHWATLGVTKRTFKRNKIAYMAWAMDVPRQYSFEQGYLFYSVDRARYLQIAAVTAEQLEVHTGLLGQGQQRHGYRLDEQEMVHWLETGQGPPETRRLFKGEGKAGLLAWRVVGPDSEAIRE